MGLLNIIKKKAVKAAKKSVGLHAGQKVSTSVKKGAVKSIKKAFKP